MAKILSLSDQIAARNAAAAREQARWAKEDAKAAKFQVAQNLDPRIGALMTAKGVQYYIIVEQIDADGCTDRVMIKGTIDHLNNLLAAGA